MRNIILALLLLLPPTLANSATYYIRTDGGFHVGDVNNSEQCNGTADVAYSVGATPNCAWNHPYEALPPGGSARFAGGDTLIIGQGSYRMGYTPGIYTTETGYAVCNTTSATSCIPSDIPAGIDDTHHTTLIGENWDTKTTPPPELWGFRTYTVLMLGRPSNGNITLQYLDLTDHEECGSGWNAFGDHAGNPRWCDKYSLTNGYAVYGVYGYGLQDIDEDVAFIDIDIHGVGATGYSVCGFGDLTFTGGSVKGNGTGGIYIETADAIDEEERDVVGVTTYDNMDVSWNGCIENYPVSYPPHDRNCYGQEGGGDGDGVGTATMLHDVVVTNSQFNYNVADGFDYLHARSERHTTVENNYSAGNGGNNFKITGPMTARNNVSIGDCDFFVDKPYALIKPNGSTSISTCRGGGSPLVNKNPHSEVINNTFITTSGNNLYLVADYPVEDYDPNWGSQYADIRNNIFIGELDWQSTTTQSSAMYWIQMGDSFTETTANNLFYNVKDIATNCDSGNGDLCGSTPNCDYANDVHCGEDPLIIMHGGYMISADEDGDRSYTYDMRISASSPAYQAGIGAGTVVSASSVPLVDYIDDTRDLTNATMGSYEELIVVSCNNDPEECLNQSSCESANWYWRDDVCYSFPAPRACSTEDLAACPSFELCEGIGGTFVEGLCVILETPQSITEGPASIVSGPAMLFVK